MKTGNLTAEQLSNMELMLKPEDVGEMVADVLGMDSLVYGLLSIKLYLPSCKYIFGSFKHCREIV